VPETPLELIKSGPLTKGQGAGVRGMPAVAAAARLAGILAGLSSIRIKNFINPSRNVARSITNGR